jgi:hypothetical protein
MAQEANQGEVEITPAMVAAGVKALRASLDTEDRYLGWDAQAVRDAFAAMYELLPLPSASSTRHGGRLLRRATATDSPATLA